MEGEDRVIMAAVANHEGKDGLIGPAGRRRTDKQAERGDVFSTVAACVNVSHWLRDLDPDGCREIGSR
jgi:hypothetical protein